MTHVRQELALVLGGDGEFRIDLLQSLEQSCIFQCDRGLVSIRFEHLHLLVGELARMRAEYGENANRLISEVQGGNGHRSKPGFNAQICTVALAQLCIAFAEVWDLNGRALLKRSRSI